MIIAGSIIFGLYSIALGFLFFGYYRIRNFKLESRLPSTQFSIVIPFRNEATALPFLLNSIEKIKYPHSLFEIIFIDDGSEDNSAELIHNYFKNPISTKTSNEDFHYKIIKNERRSASPKKDAITAAIAIAKKDWILTSDADCILPENWLIAFDNYIQNYQPNMIAGPIQYLNKKSIINQYQQLDNFSLQTTTIGSFGLVEPLLCNGANLAYRKKEFIALGGFSGNDQIASGDDIFLLEKFKERDPKGLHFIKNNNAIIKTQPQNNWGEIIKQRIRWASKTKGQKNNITKLLGLIIFLCNFFVLWFGLYCLFEIALFIYFISFLFFKSVIDFLFLMPTRYFFKTKFNIPYFFLHILLYPIITVIVAVGSLKGSYQWKGRSFKK